MTRVSDWALITGAGSGIGAALARELAGRGTGVVRVGDAKHLWTMSARHL